MKFVLAPDSFKESMSAIEVCDILEKGIKNIIPNANCIKVPMADGGEGTMDALIISTNGYYKNLNVLDPLGRIIESRYGILGDNETAVIELAKASGLELLKMEERNPLITTTYGTGELIKDALDKGIKKIIIGIGGSATNDGGVGMLQALGVRFLDKNGNEIPFGGGSLNKIEKIDVTNMHKSIEDVKIEVACDVTNPFVGENGASYVFGPQKGASKEMVKLLDENLLHLANKIKEYLKVDIRNSKGAGAAGGVGGALLAFTKSELKSGVDLVIKYNRFREKIKGANYIFTGEGALDSQTIFGKTPCGVAKIGKAENIKVIAFAGRIAKGSENLYDVGITSMFSIMQGIDNLENALINGASNLQKTVENVVRILQI